MKDKIKFNEYLYQGLTLFGAIAASIVLYFLLLKFEIIIGGIISFFKILTPFFIGIIFAYLLNPIVNFFDRNVSNTVESYIFNDKKDHKKFKKGLSVTLTYLIVAIVIFLFLLFVVPNLLESMQIMITNIPKYLNNIYEAVKNMFKDNPNLTLPIEQLNSNITSALANIMVPSMDTIMSSIATGISGFINGIIDVTIGLIISVYLLFDKEKFLSGSDKVFRAVLPDKIYDTVMTTLNYTEKIFGGFMMAKIIDSLIIGVITFITLAIFEIPYPLIIALIVGITNIIPYFGPFIGAIPSAVLLLMIDPGKCITFVILIFIIQQFDGNILGPKLIGNKTGIRSFWVLFSILLFGGIFGFFGMIIGVPTFAVIYSVLKTLIDKKLAKKNA